MLCVYARVLVCSLNAVELIVPAVFLAVHDWILKSNNVIFMQERTMCNLYKEFAPEVC